MHRRCCRQAASSVHYTTSCKHSLVLLRMGEINARNMSRWLKLLISYYCCIWLVFYIIVSVMHGHTNIKLIFLLFSKRLICNIIQYSAVAPGRKPLRILNGKMVSYKNILKINLLHFYFQLVTCDDWGKYYLPLIYFFHVYLLFLCFCLIF